MWAGWTLEASHTLALSILCPRSAAERPGRRLAHVGGPPRQTPAGGGGLGSGGHLQPPDRDLSWAAQCRSPDLTQTLSSAAGHPSPGSAPRRSARFHRSHPDKGHTPTPHPTPSLDSQVLQHHLGGEHRARPPAGPFAPPPPSRPSSLNLPRLRFLSSAGVALVRKSPSSQSS